MITGAEVDDPTLLANRLAPEIMKDLDQNKETLLAKLPNRLERFGARQYWATILKFIPDALTASFRSLLKEFGGMNVADLARMLAKFQPAGNRIFARPVAKVTPATAPGIWNVTFPDGSAWVEVRWIGGECPVTQTVAALEAVAEALRGDAPQ